ncbi:MAG: FtsX-like permease family protein [Planctomycetota bacterium]
MAMTDFTIIRRSMTSRMFSTVTTIVTVAVAVTLMLTLLSMRDSGRRAFERGTGNMHMLISRDASPLVSVLNGIFYADPPARPIDQAKLEELGDAFPASFFIPTQQGDSYLGLPVLATVPEFFTRFSPDPNFNPDARPDEPNGSPWVFAEGRAFERSFEVVFGARAARETSIQLGDRIVLTHGTDVSRKAADRADLFEPHVHEEYEYEVVGILEPTGSAHDRAVFSDLTSSWIIHAHDRRKLEDPDVAATTEADLIPADRLVTGIYGRVATRPGSNVSAVIPSVLSGLRTDPTITVAQPKEEIDSLFNIVSNIDQILIAMAAAVLVSSGIAIMLALYNSMEQRKRQVAVLRVLGCSRGRVFGLVLTESAVIGLLGGAAGVLGALIGSQTVAGALRARIGLVVDPVFEPRLMLAIVLGTVLLAALAGLVPSVLAYRTPVAKNLRPIG